MIVLHILFKMSYHELQCNKDYHKDSQKCFTKFDGFMELSCYGVVSCCLVSTAIPNHPFSNLGFSGLSQPNLVKCIPRVIASGKRQTIAERGTHILLQYS